MPFAKGKSGNPKGRPARSAEDAMHGVLLACFDDAAERAVISALIREAKQGSIAAARLLLERKYGKVVAQERQPETEMVIRVEYE